MEKEIKCPKCGTKNIIGTKKCLKCHKVLESNLKSCPKCAKRNDIKAKVCSSCGFNFEHDNKTLISIIISSIVVIILLTLAYLKKSNIILDNIDTVIKIVGGIGILILLITTLTYNKKDIVSIHASEDIPESKFKLFKNISFSLVLLGLVLLLILLVYIYISIV